MPLPHDIAAAASIIIFAMRYAIMLLLFSAADTGLRH